MNNRFDVVNGFNIHINTPSCETGSIIFNINFINMEQQVNKLWVVNATEAINRTCNAIFKEYEFVIREFNDKITETCSKKKHSVIYKTDNQTTSQDLYYFYTCLGYKVEVEETPKYKEGIEYTIYKLKLMW